jgi:ubiquinol oxidase
VDAIRTQREKQGTEESVPAPLDGVGADDPMVPSSDESDWVVRLEQSFNIFATVILQ